jgi:hypothetical protein
MMLVHNISPAKDWTHIAYSRMGRCLAQGYLERVWVLERFELVTSDYEYGTVLPSSPTDSVPDDLI